MLKIKIKDVYYIVLFLMPIGITGIGLADESSMVGNVSFSDFFLAILIVLLLLGKRIKGCNLDNSAIKKKIYKFELLFFLFIMLSIVNFMRFNEINYRSGFLSVIKILICFIYANTFMDFLLNCNRKEWERFVSVATASCFVFSSCCIIGALLFVFKINNPFIDYYVTSFRATGLQEDPNLAAIYQLMSISYTLVWMRFTKRKRLSKIVLACVILGALLTVSKTCMITMVLCTFSTLFLSAISKNDRFTIRLLVVIFIAGITIFIVALRTNVLDIWISRLSMLTEGSGSAMTGRDLLWEAAFKVVNASPLNFIFGVGIGQYSDVARAYGIATTNTRAHNTLLSFWVECGIVVPLLIIILFIIVLWKLIKLSIRKKDYFALCCFWGILSIAIFMNSLNFQNNRMAYVFLVFVLVSLYRMKRGDICLANKRNDVSLLKESVVEN